MALSKTDWAIGAKVNKTFKTLPPCAYTVSRGIERLATFSALANNVIIEKISAVRLASSGCIFNVEEDFVECTDCRKITLLSNLSAITTLSDVRAFHTCRPMCFGLYTYILKQGNEERDGTCNERPIYAELVQIYGIVPRQ
uniref:Uncharacterized protein n=1 Tax=Magallana gigas TaxID=29159 RepID=A0A8W8JBP9_MAGGI|nr:uncharacterized protein LOC117692195 [Crassostrea gigas]